MFVQVIQGRTKDAAGLKKQLDRWTDELGSGAQGFLGTTAGVTDDGEFFMAARFENDESARKNSDRAEQGQWWEETSQYIDGEATFIDYTNVETWMGGGSNDAGFVQAMQGRYTDVDKAIQMGREMPEDSMRQARPDIIGGIECWKDDGTFTSVTYFTSEREAHENEKKDMPPEMQQNMQEFMSLMQDLRYIDLKDPWLI